MSYPTEDAAFFAYTAARQAAGANAGDANLSSRVFTRTLTSAEIKALKATPLSLIAAPGAGLAYVVDKVIAHLNFLTLAYTTGTWSLYIGAVGDGLKMWTESIKPLDGAASSAAEFYPSGGPVFSDVDTKAVNKAISIANTAAGGEFAAGSGTLQITIFYRVVAVS
jgi:hypothetical protein